MANQDQADKPRDKQNKDKQHAGKELQRDHGSSPREVKDKPQQEKKQKS